MGLDKPYAEYAQKKSSWHRGLFSNPFEGLSFAR